MVVNSFPMEGKIRLEKDAFCSLDGRDMLTLLKDVALNPWNMKSSYQRLQNQMLKVRKLLSASAKRPQRKRKFNRYKSDSKLAASFGLIGREKYGNQNVKKQSRHEPSSISYSPFSKEKLGSLQAKHEHVFPVLQDREEYCSLSRQDYSPLSDRTKYCSRSMQDYSPISVRAEQWDNLQGTQENVSLPTLNGREEYYCVCRQDNSRLIDRAEQGSSLHLAQGNVALSALYDRAKFCCVCRQDCSHLSVSYESIKEPKPMKRGMLKSHCVDLVPGSSYTRSVETSINEELTTKFVDVLKSTTGEDFYDSSRALNSLRTKKEDMELPHLPKEFLPSRLGHFQRLAIPIGPRFEAEVPKWEGTTNARHYNCDDLKWLGTQIWPIPGIKETNTKCIGKGRSDCCSCDFPSSVDCVRRHVSEARQLMLSEIGTAFSSWKFDWMGEEVSKTWTLKEQNEFESLAKFNLLLDDSNFWNLAMEHFPTKSRKSLVQYYYNAYIPRRMSIETRSSFGTPDSHTDQNEGDKTVDGCSTTHKRIVPSFKSLKPRIKTTL